MEPGELKPILTALVLPPAGPLLLALAGLAIARRARGFGLFIATFWIFVTLALSTNGVALVLAQVLLPATSPIEVQALKQAQAIVILGGGVIPQAPEYGAAQPTEESLGRLRYGARLARQSGKPIGYAGGVGWGATAGSEPEANIAARVLREDYGLSVRWLDDRSRDTAENAARMEQLMRRDGVQRIALVTDAIHMPRAASLFRRAGFEVVPAPTMFPAASNNRVVEWLPTSRGILACRYLVHEWLGRVVARVP